MPAATTPVLITALVLAGAPLASPAQSAGGALSDLETLGETLLEKSKSVIDESIDRSREAGQKAWEKTRDLGAEVIDRSREALEGMPGPDDDRPDLAALERAELARIWDDLIARLELGVEHADRIDAAPESSWFGEDKHSLRGDFITQLDELVVLLDDGSIFEHRERAAGIRAAVAERRERIREWREKRLLASSDDRAGFDAKIESAETQIEDLLAERARVRRELQRRLRHVGVDLDADQVSLLLARVDSDDIIQMAAVFAVLRQVTEQLQALIEDSGESVDAARRYYGMHVVLLEAVAHMQDRYVETVEEVYVPKVRSIASRTEQVASETRAALDDETDPRRQEVYRKNLAAQALTLEAAELYQRHLRTQSDRVSKGRAAIERDLELARNTYRTVELSADLYHLLEASQGAYRAIVSLQLPELVPFENLELKRKYEELSAEIARG